MRKNSHLTFKLFVYDPINALGSQELLPISPCFRKRRSLASSRDISDIVWPVSV